MWLRGMQIETLWTRASM